jgi:hypothetical protein
MAINQGSPACTVKAENVGVTFRRLIAAVSKLKINVLLSEQQNG